MVTSARLSRAESTWRLYDPIIRKWAEFCNRSGNNPLGGDPLVAAAFLTEVRLDAERRMIGPQAVERASAALSAFHEWAGRPSPCAANLCAGVREVARRTLTPTQRSTDVATPDEISKLVEYHIREGVDLLTRMVVTSAVLAFCGLLRFDDLQHILVHTDLLRIYADRVEIFLFKSKTDQHCKGAFVTIGRIGGPCCPVHLLEQLLTAGRYQRTPRTVTRGGTEVDIEDVGPLLRAVNQRRDQLVEVVTRLPITVDAMSYSEFRTSLQTLCKEAGVRHNLCPHDLRRGGATALVQGGADRVEVQKLGRWRSNGVFEFAYVREDGDRRRAVTARLPLGRIPRET
ncbi:hypothetical protein Vretimale_9800 [Volvox reticuliferus]|nr:hypothetical protein Vretimale_9800 [Volvox reticuliferus]GIM05333.1 hypothetical protein Vretimale_9800 [Volvox reticuliferus]